MWIVFQPYPRYGVHDAYVGTSFGNIANILSLTSSEIQIGVFSNIIIFVPAIIMIMLFRKSGALSKGKNRIDKTIEKAAGEGKIVLPEKTYQRTVEEDEWVFRLNGTVGEIL